MKQYYELAICDNVSRRVRGKNEPLLNKTLEKCINTNSTVLGRDNLAITVMPLEVTQDKRNSLEFKQCINLTHTSLCKRNILKAVPSIAYVERHQINPLYCVSVIFEDLENLPQAIEVLKERIHYTLRREDLNTLVNKHILRQANILDTLIEKLELK